MTVTTPAKPQSVTGAPYRTLKPTVFWAIAEAIPRRLSWSLMLLSVIVPWGCGGCCRAPG
jgi:NitT/TauT family transport system permease protein